MRIVVTGASGCLGQAIVDRASAAGHDLVALCRRPPARMPPRAEHRSVDTTTGVGLVDALAGADVVIDAVNSVGRAEAVLVDGTRRVLEAAKQAGVGHFVGVSIVGIDEAPLAYYRAKVAQERVITEGIVPWSLMRATQFHDLVATMVEGRCGVVITPRGALFQPIDVGEVAAHLVEVAQRPPSGRCPDLAGPEVCEMRALAEAWGRATGRRRWVIAPPLPGRLGRFLREGGLCAPDRAVGTIGFEAWARGR